MAAFWPILLPYGLSHNYRHAHVEGKGIALPYGERPRWQVPTLRQFQTTSLAAVTAPSFKLSPTPTARSIRQGRQNCFGKIQKAKMAYNRNLRRINMGPATGKERRGRLPKTKLAAKQTAKKSKMPTTGSKCRPTRRQKPMGPGTRLGASKNIPIVLDSDHEDAAADDEADGGAAYVPGSLVSPMTSAGSSSLQPDLSRFRYHSSLSSPAGFILRRSTPAPSLQLQVRETRGSEQPATKFVHSKESLSTGTRDKRSQRASYPSSPVTLGVDVSERESSILLGPAGSTEHGRPTTMRDARTSQLFSRVKSDTPGPYKYRARKPVSNIPNLVHKVSTTLERPHPLPQSDAHGINEHEENPDLTLADIPDFNLRRDVAQLMAVGPAFPVRDLYNLLIDSKGRFLVAKERIIRASEAQQTSQSTVLSIPPSSAPTRLQDTGTTQDEDGDETMVKIDPAFEWDTDAPEVESLGDQRWPKQRKSKSRPTKPASKPSKSHKVHNKVKVATNPSTESTMKSYSNRGTERYNGAPIIRKRTRGNSIDRDFLVPDDVVFVDSDYSSNHDSSDHGETDSSYSDTEMREYEDDDLDLHIDMRRKYAFNADMLGKKRPTLNACMTQHI